MMEELFPDIKPVSRAGDARNRVLKKEQFVFRNPLFRCPRESCQSRGPYKLGLVEGELERTCLKCGFAFFPDSSEAADYVKKCYDKQLKEWQEGRTIV